MAVSGAGACKLTVEAEVEIKANADISCTKSSATSTTTSPKQPLIKYTMLQYMKVTGKLLALSSSGNTP
ncbi:hypothetical protein ACFX1X_020863 [Malus domestica]